MALTLEEILLDMRKNKVASQPEEQPEPEYLRRDREELARVMALTDRLGPPDPPPGPYIDPNNPFALTGLHRIPEVARQLGGPSSFEEPIIPSEGGGIETVSPLPSVNLPPGVALPALPTLSENLPPTEPSTFSKVATGVGEAAATLGTGLVGFGVGAVGMAEEYLRNPPTPFSMEQFSPGYVPPPVDKDYWKNLLKKGTEISREFTYEPRTPEGKAIIEKGVTPIFEALHAFSRRASEAPLARMLFTEDQREVVAYVHELLTMTALGELGSSAKSAIGRKLSGDFQKSFVDAAKEGPQGGPNTTRLGELAEEIKTKADTIPEVQEKFSPSRINDLRARQAEATISGGDPSILPNTRAEGYEILSRLEKNPKDIATQDEMLGYVDKTINLGDPTVSRIHERMSEAMQSIATEAPIVSPTPAIRPSRGSRTQKEGTVEATIEISPQGAPRPVPDWLKETRDQIASQADALGITEKIKALALEGKTAAQIVNEIPEFQQIPIQDRTGIVRAVRSREGIPSLEEVRSGEGTFQSQEATPVAPLENPYTITGERGGPYEVTREGREAQSFTNRRSAERFAAKEWKNEQAPPEIREVENTLEAVSGSRNRGAPSSVSAEMKLQAIESANRFSNSEVATKTIQESLESGVDISKELYQVVPGNIQAQYAMLKYSQAMEVARKGINSSNRRGIMEIIHDITELFKFETDPTKLGVFGNISLSHRQKMAAQRLKADALRTGTRLEDHLAQNVPNEVHRYLIEDYLKDKPIAPPSGVGPKNMRLDGKAITGVDPVMERHIYNTSTPGEQILGVPHYRDEMYAFQTANVKDAPHELSLKIPLRVAREYGQEIADMMFPPMRAARKSVKAEVVEMREDLRKLRNLVNYKDMKEITTQVEQGNPSALKGKNRDVYNVLGDGVENYLTRANEVRNSLGIESLPDIPDPVEFMRNVIAAKSNGIYVNLAKSPKSAIQPIIDASVPEVGKMKGTLTQRTLGMSSEKDIFRQYDQFATSVAEQLGISPLTTKLREAVDHSHLNVVKMDGSQFVMQRENPGLKKFVDQWVDFVDGKPAESMKQFDTKYGPILRAFSENMAWSVLSGNLRSVMAQPFSLISTMHQAGLENTILAIGDTLDFIKKGTARKDAINESKLLSTRKDSALYSNILGDVPDDLLKNFFSKEVFSELKQAGRETTSAIREGRPRDIARATAELGLTLMEAADYESAIITYNAFKRQGQRMGLKGDELVNFADDGVVLTQSSGARGDITNIQRTALGRAVTQFGSFGLTDLSWFINNILKPSRGKLNSIEGIRETFGNVARLVGAITAFNTVAEFIGFDPPTPQPIKTALKSAEEGDNTLNTAFKVATELVGPYLGPLSSLKVGQPVGGPILGAAADLFEAGLGRPGAPNPLEPISRVTGIPTIGQWWRASRGDPQATILQRLLNYNPRTSGGGSLDSGLGSGLGNRMGSGLPK